MTFGSVKAGEIIKRIRVGDRDDLKLIAAYAKEKLFTDGPTDVTTLEILSYLKIFQPDFFKEMENEVIEMMGVFYKNPTPETLRGEVFALYRDYVKEEFGAECTPVQANILKKIREKKNFSFSAPTSTGKSYVFRKLIKESAKDVAVIVPSRALINEYADKIREAIDDKRVNILTFVERINTEHAIRNVFILTSERARELFKNKDWIDLEFVLFDEAQLSDEKSERGLYFDSIVRRVIKTFPDTKCIFAHPFIENPQAQFIKNKIDISDESTYAQYRQKTVGQIFYVHDDKKTKKFFHLGIDKQIMGSFRIESDFDPVAEAIRKGGSVLIYISKSSITDHGKRDAFEEYKEYLDMCEPITEAVALKMIDDLKVFIGASDSEGFYSSKMIEMLSRGIVTHHGSVPLYARLILERFTQLGHCRICFATSTLEQGINMPFDIVYLDRFNGSKSLSVKNLIGRAGRSTGKNQLDIGSIIVRDSAVKLLRDTINKAEPISEKSQLEHPNKKLDEKYFEFRDAIINDQFSDEYNLTNKDVKKLEAEEITSKIPFLLNSMFIGERLKSSFDDYQTWKSITDTLKKLYEIYLGRKEGLMSSESDVLGEALKIMLWRSQGKTFKNVCQFRHDSVAKTRERRNLIKAGYIDEARNLQAGYLTGFHDLPDKSLKKYPLISNKIKAENVSYDTVIFDTYEFLDRLIGFKLSDIYFAIFDQYYKKEKDERAQKLSQYFKYGTADKDEIMLLRYGLSFEDLEWIKPCIASIDEKEIKFNERIKDLSKEQKNVIDKFIFNDEK